MAVRFWVFGPVIAVALVAGAWQPLACIAGLCAGLVLWTLLEYLMHRFAFHGFAPHSQHHADPVDAAYILAPLWLSLSVAALLWILFWWLAGRPSLFVMAGILAGYLAYETIHLRIHSASPGGPVLRALRKNHYYHHFADARACFGVTSGLWDHAFRSTPRRESLAVQ
jgi:Fatty acid hydroxylase